MATFGTSAGGGDTGMPADAPTAAAATAHAASTAALGAPMASTTTGADGGIRADASASIRGLCMARAGRVPRHQFAAPGTVSGETQAVLRLMDAAGPGASRTNDPRPAGQRCPTRPGYRHRPAVSRHLSARTHDDVLDAHICVRPWISRVKADTLKISKSPIISVAGPGHNWRWRTVQIYCISSWISNSKDEFYLRICKSSISKSIIGIYS